MDWRRHKIQPRSFSIDLKKKTPLKKSRTNGTVEKGWSWNPPCNYLELYTCMYACNTMYTYYVYRSGANLAMY